MKTLILVALATLIALPATTTVQASTALSVFDAGKSDIAERRSNHCKRAYREGSICGGV